MPLAGKQPAAASPVPSQQAPSLGIVGYAGSGTAKGIADVAGAPVDLATAGINAAMRGGAAVFGGTPPQIEHPFGGSESIEKALGYIPELLGGTNPTEAAPPTTPGEKLAYSIGRGASSLAIPGIGAEAVLAKSALEGDSLGHAAAEIIRGSGFGSNAAMGAASGAGYELAQDVVSEPYKGAAGAIGGLAGGLGVAGVMGLTGAARNVVSHAWQMLDPPEVRAARLILSKASDPAAFRAALAGEVAEPLVEGSEPTTFQATGDLGIGAYERGVAASPAGIAAFAARRSAQNAAQLSALHGVADSNATASAVSNYIEGRLQDITLDHAANVAAASDSLGDALSRAGGTAFDNKTDYGTALRGSLDAMHQNAKSATNELWRAIDPDMKAAVPTVELQSGVTDLVSNIPGIAKQPTGEEAAIYDGISRFGDTVPFSDMVALRSRLTDAMRAERLSPTGSPTVLRRLGITLDGVDNTLANAAGDIASTPGQAMPMVARLQAEANAWLRVKGEGQANGGPGLSPGTAGLPGSTQFSQDIANRYAAARAGTAAEKETYTRGPVGAVLRPGPTFGSFTMPGSSVPPALFDQPERLAAFVKAAAGDPDTMNQMQDYAAWSLRNAAVRNGQLDPAKYQKWIGDHQYALRTFPDVAENFANVATAQQSLDAALAAQKDALTAYQKSAARHFLGDKDPVQAAGKALANPEQFAELITALQGNPDAIAGMKRATVDYMLGKTLSTAEAGTSGLQQIKGDTLQRFIADNRKTLSSLFSESEMDAMNSVAADIQRANRSIVAAKIPGGSNTTQDTAMMQAGPSSILQSIILKMMGTTGGAFIGHPIEGYVAGSTMSAMQAARMDNLKAAVTELMLDPRKAAAAMAKVTPASADTVGRLFAARMRALTANQILLERARGRQQSPP
jgi:hypothetical protein